MKKTLIYLALLLICMSSCSDSNIYSRQLKSEKQLIKEYLEREGINIVQEEPADDVWGEKDYYQIDEYLYYHLVKRGNTADSIRSGEKVLMRYRKYGLEAGADTISYWNTNDAAEPIEFDYLSSTSSSNTCTAWQYAVKQMKYSGSECKIICPSKLGFSADVNSVTPYGYDLKFKIKR